jgi:hypothetical protein
MMIERGPATGGEGLTDEQIVERLQALWDHAHNGLTARDPWVERAMATLRLGVYARWDRSCDARKDLAANQPRAGHAMRDYYREAASPSAAPSLADVLDRVAKRTRNAVRQVGDCVAVVKKDVDELCDVAESLATCAELAATELRAEGDDPERDAADFANPAWWRGNEAGAYGVVVALTRVLDQGHVGAFGGVEELQKLAQRISLLRAAEADTARLDWLERTAKAQGEVRIGYTEAWSESGDYGDVLSEGPEEFWLSDETNGNADPTLREAIDAARKEAGNADYDGQCTGCSPRAKPGAPHASYCPKFREAAPPSAAPTLVEAWDAASERCATAAHGDRLAVSHHSDGTPLCQECDARLLVAQYDLSNRLAGRETAPPSAAPSLADLVDLLIEKASDADYVAALGVLDSGYSLRREHAAALDAVNDAREAVLSDAARKEAGNE